MGAYVRGAFYVLTKFFGPTVRTRNAARHASAVSRSHAHCNLRRTELLDAGSKKSCVTHRRKPGPREYPSTSPPPQSYDPGLASGAC